MISARSRPRAFHGAHGPANCRRSVPLEDFPVNIESHEKTAPNAGYGVIQAALREEALENLGSTPRPFDIILSDFNWEIRR